VYFLTSLRAPKATLKEIDRRQKQFLWAGSEALTGGKCKLNWPRSTKLGPDNPCTNNDKLLFAVTTSIIVGDGDNISFSHSAWFQGFRPCYFAPNVYKLSRKKNRSLKGALDNNWIRDIDLQHPGFTAQVFTKYTQLWRAVAQLQLQPNSRDEITWKLTKDGKYSTSSAYRAQFLGSCKTNFCSLIWKTWALPKCKFFSWLIL
jgi:hypothetical protein